MWLTDLVELLEAVTENETSDTVIDGFEVIPELRGIIIKTGYNKIAVQKTDNGILINGKEV